MPLSGGPLHVTIPLVFGALIIALFVRAILSFFPISPGNPFVRFFNGITAPFYDPLLKRLPRIVLGMFDVSGTIVLLTLWWAFGVASFLLVSSLPAGW